MASENVVENASSCVTDPNFAIVCSFLEKFGKLCGLVYPDFEQLQEMLENTHEGNFLFIFLCGAAISLNGLRYYIQL